MTKLHFKKWVVVVLSILAVCVLVKGLNALDKAELKKCTDYGYSETYCRRAMQ